MANTYFQFKEFIVHQDRCAMKVTTDGCLFGAYAAHWSLGHLVNKPLGADVVNNCFNVLDVGAGTGLLSLMIAQKNINTFINAVEIDEKAALQAQENFNLSPWKNRLQIHRHSIQDFTVIYSKKFDLIISNPPFYEQQLKGENKLKNTAHHSAELTLETLFSCVEQLIKNNGFFIILLPFYRTDEAIKIANTFQLFLQEKVLAKQTPKHDCFRSILIFSGIKTETIKQEKIVIKDEQNQYTTKFQELLRDYYLNI